MAFVTKDDILNYIEADDLDQITDADDTIIDDAILDAEEYTAEMLRQRFDVPFEFAQTGTDRNRQLLKQTTAVAIFYLAERLPTDVLPESRELAFERASQWLKDVAAGRRMVDLKELDEGSIKGYRIRYGNGTASGGNHF